MYKLTDGTIPTEEIKKSFKENPTVAYIKFDDTTISYDDYLTKVDMNEERFVPDEGFIGQAVAREIEIEITNEDNKFNLENKEVEYYQGAIQNDGTIKYINFGKFIVLKPDNNDTKETCKFTARDYMQKFNIKYVHNLGSNYTYLQLAQDICEQAGVELGSTEFRNSNKIIKDNPFIDGEQCRFVLKQIAKIAFSVAYIGQDNKLYIGFDNKTTVDEEITTDNYIELSPNEQTKPITVITLRSSEVPDSKWSIRDEKLIKEYGENELSIEEDYFAYTDELRKDLIQAAKVLFGLSYTPVETDLLGSVYLNFNDIVEITNLKGKKFKTFCLNLTSSYNGSLYNSVESPALTDIEQEYEYEEEQDLSIRRAYVKIDKANQEIEAAVKKIDGNTSEISALKITTGNISLEVSKKIGANEVVSSLNISPDVVKLKSNRFELSSTYTTISQIGHLVTTSGNIAGIDFSQQGLFYSGSNSKDGFGLWKNGVHSSEGSYIIFHAGANSSHISEANFRVYQNGTVYASLLKIVSNKETATGMEIMGVEPFIDLKANNSAAYTTRIIDYGNQLIFASNSDLTIANKSNTAWRGVRCSRVSLENEENFIWSSQNKIYISTNGDVHFTNKNNTGYINIYASRCYLDNAVLIWQTNGQMLLSSLTGVSVVTTNNSAYLPILASEFTKNSSRRYKDNIVDMTEERANQILKLNVKTFDYNKDSKMNKKDVSGLIAEEVSEIIKEAVVYKNIDGKNLPDSIDYTTFVPYLIKQVQMLHEQNNKLQKTLENLENKINKLTK